MGLGGDVEGGEAEDASREDEDPQTEDERQTDALAGGKRERPHDARDRREDDDIGDDVVDGVCVPEGGDVDAVAGELLVEDVLDRRALKDGSEDGGDGVAADDADAGVAGDAKPALREDTKVEEEDAQFCEVDGEFVEDLVEVEHLELGFSSVKGSEKRQTHLKSSVEVFRR